ncbi:MAG: type I restriction endonuclease, partial [Sedimentisphaerales bacterium]|nr:type I restriction endonuclease [Sedimentisphaerales bacterium]
EGEGHASRVPLLQRLNPGAVTEAAQAEAVIRRQLTLRADIEGNRDAWEYLKGLKTVFVQAERREHNLRLIEAERPEENRFHVTDEFTFQSGARRIRADVVFLVNGIPVIVIETKAATRLEGIAFYDRLGMTLPEDPYLVQRMRKSCELENYLCHPETLLAFAQDQGRKEHGEPFVANWWSTTEEAIRQVEEALRTLGKDPWSRDIKASEEFLEPLFKRFYENLKLPNLMRKTGYHRLAAFVPKEVIDNEIVEALDAIVAVAEKARPRVDT